MVPYLITFLISILLCGCAELAMKHSRAGGILLLGAAVLPPVFLAGARDFTVGTDIRAYGGVFSVYVERNGWRVVRSGGEVLAEGKNGETVRVTLG